MGPYVLPAAMHVSSCRNELLSQMLQLPPVYGDLPVASNETKRFSYEVNVKQNKIIAAASNKKK